MIRAFTPSVRRSVSRSLAVLAGASCDKTNPVTAPTRHARGRRCRLADTTTQAAPADSSDSIADSDSAAGVGLTGDSVALADSLTMASAISYPGLPYGPTRAVGGTDFEWGPGALYLEPGQHLRQHDRHPHQRRETEEAATRARDDGRAVERLHEHGRFDFGKWKNRMNTFKTTAIKNAVAAGVADGTIIGNTMIDEPETPKWGGVMTKSLIDQMATYVKDIFPTLPVGINQGGAGYKWRTGERFHGLDYVLNQYHVGGDQRQHRRVA